ncbi:MAG: hypothetical protein ABEJ65_00570, partial [bacterium]
DVVPELSDVTLTQGGSVQNCTFQTASKDRRRAELKVAVEDGHTLVIGGLNKVDQTKTTKRVPGFGSLPLIGNLFTQTNVDDQTRNITIFLTVNVISVKSGDKKSTKAPSEQGNVIIDSSGNSLTGTSNPSGNSKKQSQSSSSKSAKSKSE